MPLPKYFNNLVQFATRPMTIQRIEWAGYFNWAISEMRMVCIPLEGGERVFYIEGEDLKRGFKVGSEMIMTKEGWDLHLKKYEEEKNNFSLLVEEIKNVSNSQDAVLAVYEKWVALINKWCVYGFMPFAIENTIDPEFRKLIEHMPAKDKDFIIAAVSSPSELNDYQKMRVDIIDAALSNDINIVKKLADKWGWYSEYSFIEDLLSEQYFIDEIKKIDIIKAKEEKIKIFEDLKNSQEQYDLACTMIKDEQAKLYAEILHTYTFLRTDRIDIYKKGQIGMRKIFDLIALLLSIKTGQKWERIQVVNLLNSEILGFLKNNILPNKKDIDMRVNGEYIYLSEYGKVQIITDKSLIDEAHIIIHKDVKTDISGSVAFPGKISGRVTLVRSKDDLVKVKEGDILVSRTTMPDYTVAMKIAVAFVTEEGGITSHAAIIARELKKPCIVGTGNCTKILKDGDVVEVDADNGVVRIIK